MARGKWRCCQQASYRDSHASISTCTAPSQRVAHPRGLLQLFAQPVKFLLPTLHFGLLQRVN